MPQESHTFLTEAGMVLTALGALYALANCFFGYKLQRLWILLAGFLIGLLAGFGGLALQLHAGIALLIGVVLGVLLAFIANRAYRVGIFLLCFFSVYLMLYGLVPSSCEWLGIVLGLAGGITAGVLAVKFLRPVIILTTAIGSGMSAGQLLLSLFDVGNLLIVLIVGAVLALCGLIVQFRTTIPASAQESR